MSERAGCLSVLGSVDAYKREKELPAYRARSFAFSLE